MKQVTILIGQFAIFLLLLWGSWYGALAVREKARQLEATQQEHERYPVAQLTFEQRRQELQRRQGDLQQVYRMLPKRSDFGQVIGAVEKEAGRARVVVSIPEVHEPVMESASPQVEAIDDLYDVRLTLRAEGDPGNLVRFLYAVEHLPYIIHLESWKLELVSEPIVRSLAVRAPASRQRLATSGSANVEAQLVLAVIK